MEQANVFKGYVINTVKGDGNVEVLEDTVVIEVFSPAREDYLP